jgi:hypothetical protein
MFLTKYAHPIAYHTLLTKFTQIHLQKGERIRDFNLHFSKANAPELEKQQPIVNQTKRPLQMNCNLVDELTNLWITLPFM